MKFNIKKYDTVSSTNIVAMEAVLTGRAGEGQVFTASFQTAGKGTGNNSWESGKGKNLLFSLVLSPRHINPSQQFMITQVISLAIKEVLDELLPGVEVKIKWPNDIYAGKGKIAGILIQNIIKGTKLDTSIIGIGLNVNQKKFYSDAPNPVSIMQLIHKELRLDNLLNRILNRIDFFYEQSKIAPQTINRQYMNSLFGKDEISLFESKDEIFRGIVRGITDYGQLIVEHPEKGNLVFNFKEVRMIIG